MGTDCRLSVFSHAWLQVYQQEKLQQFQWELQAWKAQKKRQEEEFIITDRTVKVNGADVLNTPRFLNHLPRGQSAVVQVVPYPPWARLNFSLASAQMSIWVKKFYCCSLPHSQSWMKAQ